MERNIDPNGVLSFADQSSGSVITVTTNDDGESAAESSAAAVSFQAFNNLDCILAERTSWWEKWNISGKTKHESIDEQNICFHSSDLSSGSTSNVVNSVVLGATIYEATSGQARKIQNVTVELGFAYIHTRDVYDTSGKQVFNQKTPAGEVTLALA